MSEPSMDRGVDLSRQGLTALAQIPRDLVRRVEREGGGGGAYAVSLAQNRLGDLRDLELFRHVVELDLSGNKLQSLAGIEALQLLESLNVARNCLTTIDTVPALRRLQVLNVAENNLSRLDSLVKCPQLTVLDASYNNIGQWPSLCLLTSLESIDLSSNLLEGPPPVAAATLFPPTLRRLGLAKNQIHELAGVVCLGGYLPQLEVLRLEGNPATQRIAREGGSLEFLTANLFPRVATRVGHRREDFVVPEEVLVAVEDAAERGDEATLLTFLITGTVMPSVTSTISTTTVRATANAGHGKIDEVTGPTAIARQSSPGQSAAIAPAEPSTSGLTKESKMDMWRRVTEERKAQDKRLAHAPVQPPPMPPMPPPPSMGSRALGKVSPPRHPPPAAAAVAAGAGAQVDTGPLAATMARPPTLGPHEPQSSIAVLAGQLKSLQDQLSGMRKYMNVWIRREQQTREGAARRLQRCYRRHRDREMLQGLVLQSRDRRHAEYGLAHCSTTTLRSYPWASHLGPLHLHAVAIQRIVRGWLMRVRLSRWMYATLAARRIQLAWRRARRRREQYREAGERLLRGHWRRQRRRRPQGESLGISGGASQIFEAVGRVAVELTQLQRVCVAQERMLSVVWEDLRRVDGFFRVRFVRAVTRLQRAWRGRRVRRQYRQRRPTANTRPPPCTSRDDARVLREEVNRLAQLVATLTPSAQAEPPDA